MRLKHPENENTKMWAVYERLCQMMARQVNTLWAMYVWGPPGIGKTWLSYRAGLDSSDQFTAITLTDETSAAEMRGHYLLGENGNTYWHDGPFTHAARNGLRMVINEISRANEDVEGILHPFLENPDTARLTLPNGSTITPAEGFHVIATDNFAPDKLPESLHDRFQATVKLSQPHPDALANLPPEFWWPAVMAYDSHEDETEDLRGLSARQWNSLCTLEPEFELKMSCALVWGPELGETIYRCITRLWASDSEEPWDDENPGPCRESYRKFVVERYGIPELTDGVKVVDNG